MNMSLTIIEGKYGAIDTYDSSYHGYYIIKFSSLPYTLQVESSIDGQVISSGNFYVKEPIHFQSILILIIMSYKNLRTQFFL